MWAMILWQYRQEIAVGALILAALAGAWHIKHTYAKAEEQARQIQALTKEVDNAKKAIQLQVDTQKALGRIDARTFSNISAVLHSPVPSVLIPAGVSSTVRPANSPN